MTITEALPEAPIEAAPPEKPPFAFSSAAEAGAACGVSKKSILRRITALIEAGAVKDERGNWQITPDQLRAVGLHPGRPRPADHDPIAAVDLVPSRPVSLPVDEPSRSVSPWEDAAFQAEYTRMRARLAELEAELDKVRQDRDHYRTQLAVAEALAGERLPMSEVLRIIAVAQPRSWWQRRPKQITAGPQS